MDLVEFLTARLDEDERAAQAATPGPWWHNPGKQWLETEAFVTYDLSKGLEFVGHGGPHPFTGCVAGTGPADHPQSMADAAHIARHDPARVLAEVDGKRLLLADHPIQPETYPRPAVGGREVGGPYFPFGCANCHAEMDTGEVHGFGYCLTWKALALPYASHADYDEAWRP
ncbi:DUF6221 family protein [Streptomyces sp. NPDC048018]|uniref:DUF6221 family protein n=1 Tax=Streptomyces sp. NPDC048018 TaxID=3365499 RepID=UPI0037130B16